MTRFNFLYKCLVYRSFRKCALAFLSALCVCARMDICLKVDGYLLMGDDVLYNFWTPFSLGRLNYGYSPYTRNQDQFDYWMGFWPNHNERANRDLLKIDLPFLAELDEEERKDLLNALTDSILPSPIFYTYLKKKKQDFYL